MLVNSSHHHCIGFLWCVQLPLIPGCVLVVICLQHAHSIQASICTKLHQTYAPSHADVVLGNVLPPHTDATIQGTLHSHTSISC